jgi:monomeric isocitrate dehydrogenase
VLSTLLTTLGPAAAIMAFFMWLMHRDTARSIRQMQQRTDATLRDWRRETAARQRLHDLQDQLWLDSLSPDVRAGILDSRRQIAARECVAQEILHQEQAAEATSRNGAQLGGRGEV